MFARGIVVSLLVLVTAVCASPSARAQNDVRVRLQSLKTGPISVSGIAMRFPGSAPGEMGFRSVKISWKNSAKGRAAWTVEDRDSGKVLARVQARTFDVVGMGLRVGLQSMPERLSFAPRPTGSVDVIAKLDLESYVRGVLPSEMPASWPLEALKAQAIAARTFVLFRKQARAKVDATYDVESDVMDQVYRNPLGEEPLAPKKSEMVERAIRETKGVVLLNGGTPHPFATFFHADCGGHTEEPAAVWGASESAGTTPDESCPMNPMASWTLTLSPADIAKKLKPGAQLSSIKVIDRTSSGRIGKLQLVWADGTVTSTTGHGFRMSMGHEKVRSAKFEISVSAKGFELKGRGFGHGVGMCQWGARHLAKGGKGHREILSHYFPRAIFSDSLVAQAPADSTEIKPRGL